MKHRNREARRWASIKAAGIVLAALVAQRGMAAPPRPAPFGIQIVDDQTGRGVPLVELTTVSEIRCISDSAGYVAIDDPALLDHKVYFRIKSDGYSFPRDGFGNSGEAMQLTPGGSTTLKIHRVNIAQRIYRVTGEGIYRDSVLLGRPVPLRHPLLDGGVVGQDSVQAAFFHGKWWWFFGDTNRQSYPLGQFGTSGASSRPPTDGGLDPDKGIDLDYFVDRDGFSRPMIQREGNHPAWLDGLAVVKDSAGKDVMIGRFSRMASLGHPVALQLYQFNESAGKFDVKVADLPMEAPIALEGHPFHVNANGVDMLYFGNSFPQLRVKATLQAVRDPSQYEAYTCLKPGTRTSRGTADELDRDAAGKVIWGWKRATAPLSPEAQEKLIGAGALDAQRVPFRLVDAKSHRYIRAHAGSCCWNEYLKKYILIDSQVGGKSSELGEVWYAEADRPEGPWREARKIVTHEHFSFYNPCIHPFLAPEGGKYLYFEGTYSNTFAGAVAPTPRYDYNQVMYRLDLSDPRLHDIGH